MAVDRKNQKPLDVLRLASGPPPNVANTSAFIFDADQGSRSALASVSSSDCARSSHGLVPIFLLLHHITSYGSQVLGLQSVSAWQQNTKID